VAISGSAQLLTENQLDLRQPDPQSKVDRAMKPLCKVGGAVAKERRRANSALQVYRRTLPVKHPANKNAIDNLSVDIFNNRALTRSSKSYSFTGKSGSGPARSSHFDH
jgi:hypothetical protein